MATTDEVLRGLTASLPHRRRVLVIGGYGCGNVGDEAILRVILRDLRSLGAKPRVISVRPDETRRLQNVASFSASPRGMLAALARTDAVMIGGGGIFSGYMGPRSRHLPTVARMAKALGRAVIFRAIGVYESTPPSVARSLTHIMEGSEFVSVRDEASVAALRDFGLHRDVVVEDDPALRLEVPAVTGREARRVGIAVRRVRDGRQQTGLGREFSMFLDALVESGRTPVLLPFSWHPNEHLEQDGAYADELRGNCEHPSEVVIEHHSDPDEMLRAVASLDAIVAMRFHAIVFAAIVGVSTVAIPYDDKCSAFLSSTAARMARIAPDDVKVGALMLALASVESRMVA